MMFVHGWQSYIWNTVLSERVRLFGCDKPVVGDLVYSAAEGSGEGDEEEEILDEEDDGTTAVDPESLDPNLDDDETGEEVTHLSKPTAVIKKSKVAKARALTEQDIASNRYTIFDVILPLPGFSIIYPEGVLGDRYKQIMKDDGLDWQDLFRKQKYVQHPAILSRILFGFSLWYSILMIGNTLWEERIERSYISHQP
jgi:tRNA pseudouridine13 synthase